MKKLFVLLMVLGIVSLICLGCGEGPKTPLPPKQSPQLKFYEISEANMSGTISIKAVSSVETALSYVGLYLDTGGGSIRRSIIVYYYNDLGQLVPEANINITKETNGPGESDSFDIEYREDNVVVAAPKSPGKARVHAEYNGSSADVFVYTMDTLITTLPNTNMGLTISDTGRLKWSDVKEDCFLWQYPNPGNYSLITHNYIIHNYPNVDALVEVKTVDLALLTNIDNNLEQYKGYIAEVPSGGYVKFYRDDRVYVLEYTPNTNFK